MVHTLAFVILALGFTACSPPNAGENSDGVLEVVATTNMIGYTAERVAGDRARVTSLMGPGVDPHLYRASAGDVRRLSRAHLILYNGLHLEAAMSDVLDRMDGRTRTRAVTAGIDREQLLTPPEWEGQYDPHVWMDVRLWMEAVREVADALSEVDPDGAEEYERSAAELVRELEELETWVRDRVGELPPQRRILVTAHDAFNYFAEAYGFEVRGLQGLSTATEAGTGDVRHLADFIVEHRVPSIFIETSVPRRNVEAVQAAVRSRGNRVEIGGELFSDAMGPAGTPEGTYSGMIRHNVSTIVDGLSRRVADTVAEGTP